MGPKRLLEDYRGLRNLRGCKVQRAKNSGFFVVVTGICRLDTHAKGLPELAGLQASLACSADRLEFWLKEPTHGGTVQADTLRF